jgi:hypothetical protein
VKRKIPKSLWLCLAIYGAIWFSAAGEVGVVGEVAAGWYSGNPPEVVASTIQEGGAAHRAGPFTARETRPMELLSLGWIELPIAVNLYTGGIADWPSRLLHAASGSWKAVLLLHGLMGGALIWLTHRFLSRYGTPVAAAAGALWLATDWSFSFYKHALGGTEILLQAAGLLCLWGLWRRRWGDGGGLIWALAGAGAGLMAKLPFLAFLAALAAAAISTRRGRAPMSRPEDRHWKKGLAIFAVAMLPLLLANLHHAQLETHVRSHDSWALQIGRIASSVSGGPSSPRESWINLWNGMVDPLAFLERIYGAAPQSTLWPLRLAGWILALAGSILAWRSRHPSPSEQLLRFTSLLAPLLLLGATYIAKDMHHLAMACPILAIWAGLAIDRLCGTVAPPRGPRRMAMAAALSIPFAFSGISDQFATKHALAGVEIPTFTEDRQASLVETLRKAGVKRVVTMDYEVYGILEVRSPEIRAIHGWGAISHERWKALPGLLRLAEGGHLLVLEASMGMIYNLRPSTDRLQKEASKLGLSVEEVESWPEGQLSLYKVEPL